jgi:hypothetical protein
MKKQKLEKGTVQHTPFSIYSITTKVLLSSSKRSSYLYSKNNLVYKMGLIPYNVGAIQLFHHPHLNVSFLRLLLLKTSKQHPGKNTHLLISAKEYLYSLALSRVDFAAKVHCTKRTYIGICRDTEIMKMANSKCTYTSSNNVLNSVIAYLITNEILTARNILSP